MKIPRISTKSIIITLAVIAIGIPLSVNYIVIPHIRSTKKMQYHSNMLTLQACINEELQEYYKKNGSYPENLQLIKDSILNHLFISGVPEEHKDGHILNEFKYSTDGSSYIMILEVRGYTYIDKGQKGERASSELK